jgi:hypothetical protein
MAVNLSPLGGVGAQFFNNDGVPLAGGLINTYLAGTNTPANTYTTSAGNVAHSNPIVLNAAGKVPTGEIWLTNGVSYKFVIKDSGGSLIGTYDNILGINDSNLAVQNFIGTGIQTTFVLSIAPPNENATSVFINGVYQQKNTYSLSGTSLIFSAAPPYTATIEVVY